MRFSLLGCHVGIECAEATLAKALAANFDALAAADRRFEFDLHYQVHASADSHLVLGRTGRPFVQYAQDAAELLFLLEQDLVVELQKLRADLLFLHAAALDYRGNVCLLVGESGSGKSTTSWALLHHEFRYLSDELSPVDVEKLAVFAFPHALCLKQPPAAPYAPPADALRLGRTIRVPATAMPLAKMTGPRPLAALLFLTRYSPGRGKPTLRKIAAAEASASLYVSTLNALAHSRGGLDAVVRITENLPCYELAAADLQQTCTAVRATLDELFGDSSRKVFSW